MHRPTYIAAALVAGLLAAALMTGCDGAALDTGLLPTPVEDISAADLEARLERGGSLVVLDVRSASEYQAGRIPGSVNIPLSELSSRHGELDPQAPTVCVCSAGHRSAQAAQVLVLSGFRNVMNLESGLGAYDGPWESNTY